MSNIEDIKKGYQELEKLVVMNYLDKEKQVNFNYIPINLRNTLNAISMCIHYGNKCLKTNLEPKGRQEALRDLKQEYQELKKQISMLDESVHLFVKEGSWYPQAQAIIGSLSEKINVCYSEAINSNIAKKKYRL